MNPAPHHSRSRATPPANASALSVTATSADNFAASSSATSANARRLECELLAPTGVKASSWAEIARACAEDVGLELTVHHSTTSSRSPVEPTLTLHLPVEFAASQHPAWCLACRIACFCPTLRVSVLVRSEGMFRSPPTTSANTAGDEAATHRASA